MRKTSVFILLAFGALVQNPRVEGQAPTPVTLSPAASPAAGEPGVTSISITGSNFPAGTITASSVSIQLKPSASGPTATTTATAVTLITGTTRRVTFTIPSSLTVSSPAAYLVSLSGTTTTGTSFASSNTAALTVDPVASLLSLSPNSATPGQSVSVKITGSFTSFVQGSTQANFGAGISVGSGAEGAAGPVTVTNSTTATAQLTIDPAAASGSRTVVVTTGPEQASLSNGFTVQVLNLNPSISSFNPTSASVGTLITVNGSNFVPTTGAVPQISLAKQGGGTLSPTLSSFTNTSLSFAVPTGAATGTLTVTVNGKSATSAGNLTILAPSSFTISASPSPATLIQGQSVAYTVQLASANGFNQLAQLAVTGLPQGITAAFKPSSISVGQPSILTLTAPAGQAVANTNISISASATVAGFAESPSTQAGLSVVAPTTTLLGRTVTTDALETPVAGVTITTLGADGNGNTTGCTGHTTTSDAAGNFSLTNLPQACTGPQLISFDGSTATSPPGKYDGVHLVFTLNSAQVTASPVLVHLPRVDNAETFYVQQNYATDQSYFFASIPGVSITVYAGTTLTLPNGTQPNPFPISVVQVLPDRLPDQKPVVPTMVGVFYLSFQPTGTHASQPVAVTYPNVLNTAPGTDMPLMVLDATHGSFTPIGTGKVSANGASIVPDPDPAHPGHAYGITNFDW